MSRIKTALITGGAGGIGRAAAIEFAKNDYNVIINYRSSEAEAKETKEYIESLGKKAIIFKADVSKRAEVEEMFSLARDTFGGVDVLVNNAGIAQQKMFCDITENDFDLMFGTIVKGAFNCTQCALPFMVHNKYGKIINISSMWGVTGASCEVHYSAAKAALIGLTKALARELAPSGITVNCIAPGVIDTKMNASLGEETLELLKEESPMGRFGTPEEVAQLMTFLSSKAADFITGQVIGIDGAYI